MSAAQEITPPFLPGDRVKRGHIFMYRQLGKRLHCVQDCAFIEFNENGMTRAQWLVKIVGITAKGDGAVEGRFYARDIRLIVRKGTLANA